MINLPTKHRDWNKPPLLAEARARVHVTSHHTVLPNDLGCQCIRPGLSVDLREIVRCFKLEGLPWRSKRALVELYSQSHQLEMVVPSL
jgi:hypothetical protein